MKKILIQYFYILVIYTFMFVAFSTLMACETVKDETPPVCMKDQISTKENPCREEKVNINTLSDAIKKLGESGTMPK